MINGFKKESNILLKLNENTYRMYRSLSSDGNNHVLWSMGELDNFKTKHEGFIFKDSICAQPSIFLDYKILTDDKLNDSFKVEFVNNFLNRILLEFILIKGTDTVIFYDGIERVGIDIYQFKNKNYDGFYVKCPYPNNSNTKYTLYSNYFSLKGLQGNHLKISMNSKYLGYEKHPQDLFLFNDTAFIEKNHLKFHDPSWLLFEKVKTRKIKKNYKIPGY